MTQMLEGAAATETTNRSGQPQGSRVEVLGRTLVLPGDLLKRYVDVAMRFAIPRRLDGGRWYADLADYPGAPGFRGVWADGESPKACLDTLAEVLQEWIILKLADEDRDLPVVDEIDLSVLLPR